MRYRLTSIFAAAALALFTAAPASAAIIAGWDGIQVPGVPGINDLDEGAPGVTGDLFRGTGLTTQGTAANYRSRGWTVGGDLAAAQLANDFLEFGFSTSGNAFNLSLLRINYNRGVDGPRNIAILLTSLNGGATSTSVFTDTLPGVSAEFHDIDISSLDNVSSATFRLYGWGAVTATGTFSIEDDIFGDDNALGLVIEGTAVPVPAALPLMVVGLAGLGLLRRRG